MENEVESGHPERYGKLWERDELVLAFDLYCRIPFKKTKANNPRVRSLASLLRRSPASVARKLGNFGAFDPALKSQQISGLTHGSKLDQQIWDEFHNDWNGLVMEAELIRDSIESKLYRIETEEIRWPSGPSEKIASRKVRIHQSFFRETVLSSYSNTCCVTGITISECLIASHIIPWHANEVRRTDPRNGLCLSATFDRLFDGGLISMSEDLTLLFGSAIQQRCTQADRQALLNFRGQRIRLPDRFEPASDALAWHRQNIYRGG